MLSIQNIKEIKVFYGKYYTGPLASFFGKL